MATENKRLNTRLMMKYDSYSNWTTNNPVLLAGELAIATIASGNLETVNPNGIATPQVLIKVGDGSSHYNDLKFVSGLAADVYDWAKAEKKPSYTATEISGLKDFIANDENNTDTDTQYQIVVVDAASYKYELQSKGLKDSTWTKVSDLDLSAIDARLDATEGIANAAKAAVDVLNAAADQAGSVLNSINTKIQTLDANVSQTAGSDGLALNVVEVDGVITSVSGSIAANTYDAYGSASAVLGADGDASTVNTVHGAKKAAAEALKAAQDAQKAADDEAAARDAAIKALDYNGYEAGNESGATISFVGTISEADGVIEAKKRDLVFNSSYDPATNKAATMADVTGAVADLAGAMHFEGVSDTDPVNVGVSISGKPDYVAAAGDIVIYGVKEYVYDGTKWVELGDEGSAAAQIQALDVADIVVGADSTLSVVGQTDGSIHATPVKIQIAQSQVTGLEDALKNGGEKDAEQDLAIKANKDAIDVINGVSGDNTGDTGKSMRTVAGEVATAQINALDKADSAVEGEYVSAVSQTDGVITVTRAKLPTIPSLIHEDSTATTPTAESVSVVADIDVNGHTITDTRVNVATTAGIAAAIAKLDADKDVSSAKHVMTGVTEVDGVITNIDEVQLADVAFTGKVQDLIQDADTYIVFDCGSSTKNI